MKPKRHLSGARFALDFPSEGVMHFDRDELNASVISSLKSPKAENRCIGRNFMIEENVSDRRRFDVEAFLPRSRNHLAVTAVYFRESVQGRSRGHLSSTFDALKNHLAILPESAIDPSWKLNRLERIDGILEMIGLGFEELKKAHERGDNKRLSKFVNVFNNFPGNRPYFCVVNSDIESLLGKGDWLQRYIDCVGLYHHYPYDPNEPALFALMEYSAGEIIQQARAQGIERCFALPTVLESRDNAAFCPTPRSSGSGYAVNLREPNFTGSGVREMLHFRLDYSWEHVIRVEKWSGADLPDVEPAGENHLDFLRRESGRDDFGIIGA